MEALLHSNSEAAESSAILLNMKTKAQLLVEIIKLKKQAESMKRELSLRENPLPKPFLTQNEMRVIQFVAKNPIRPD
jgi:hypothetical protein